MAEKLRISSVVRVQGGMPEHIGKIGWVVQDRPTEVNRFGVIIAGEGFMYWFKAKHLVNVAGTWTFTEDGAVYTYDAPRGDAS